MVKLSVFHLSLASGSQIVHSCVCPGLIRTDVDAISEIIYDRIGTQTEDRRRKGSACGE